MAKQEDEESLLRAIEEMPLPGVDRAIDVFVFVVLGFAGQQLACFIKFRA